MTDQHIEEFTHLVSFSSMDEITKKMPTHVGPYRFVNHLGQGSFAQVYRAVHDTTGEQVAVKAILGKKLKQNVKKNQIIKLKHFYAN